MKLPLSACSAIALLLCSCADRTIVGRGGIKNETRQLAASGFDKIDISAPVDARITVGGAPSLSFEGYSNVLPYLRSEVRGSTLHIYIKEPASFELEQDIIANISIPSLTALDISGATDADITGPISTREFSLGASGASEVSIQELHVQSFNADLSGATKLNLKYGDIGTGRFDVSGSGEIYAFGVAQDRADLDLSGAAEAEVFVRNKLNVEISGAGEVAYKGNPTVNQKVSGAGNVRQAD